MPFASGYGKERRSSARAQTASRKRWHKDHEVTTLRYTVDDHAHNKCWKRFWRIWASNRAVWRHWPCKSGSVLSFNNSIQWWLLSTSLNSERVGPLTMDTNILKFFSEVHGCLRENQFWFPLLKAEIYLLKWAADSGDHFRTIVWISVPISNSNLNSLWNCSTRQFHRSKTTGRQRYASDWITEAPLFACF
jgi:hypothetical protein